MMKEKKEMNALMKKLNKKHGDNSVMLMGNNSSLDVPKISTGVPPFDIALGGGVPKGKIIEVFGENASGKTSLSLKIISEIQRDGGKVAFIDAEHALDPNRATFLGVDIDNLYISQPDNGEQALQIVNEMVLSGLFDLIVIDSVSALVPRAELEGEIGDSHMALQARMMSQAMRILTASASKTGTTLLFINQIRRDLMVKYGDNSVTGGGNALKFYSSQRIRVSAVGKYMDGKDKIGHNMKIKVMKNKISSPFKEAEVKFMYETGFDKHDILIDTLLKEGVVTQGGAYYTIKLDKEQKFLGREKLCDFLKEGDNYNKALLLVQ